MKTYPRFKVYTLFREQQGQCVICKSDMNIHDLEVDHIIEDGIMCFPCTEKKKNIVSNYDTLTSLMDMDLRPISEFSCPTKLPQIENDIGFDPTPNPIIQPDFSYVHEAFEEEEDLDPEEKIQTSWYHRALLGDEHREIYDDGKDTDFELAQAEWESRHADEDDCECDQNTQMLGLDF